MKALRRAVVVGPVADGRCGMAALAMTRHGPGPEVSRRMSSDAGTTQSLVAWDPGRGPFPIETVGTDILGIGEISIQGA